MNVFQSRLLTIIKMHPGINRAELALVLGLPRLSINDSRYLRHLEDRGCITSMFVKAGGRRRVKVYRVKA